VGITLHGWAARPASGSTPLGSAPEVATCPGILMVNAPHSRGDHPILFYRKLSANNPRPTNVGITPTRNCGSTRRRSTPHSRGDHPKSAPTVVLTFCCNAPRTWGSLDAPNTKKPPTDH